MKVVTFAAGLAAGYVLGTRAGREKYQQIVATARKVSSHPSVQQAQDKAKDLIDAGTDAVTAKISPDSGPVARPARRKTVTTMPDTTMPDTTTTAATTPSL